MCRRSIQISPRCNGGAHLADCTAWPPALPARASATCSDRRSATSISRPGGTTPPNSTGRWSRNWRQSGGRLPRKPGSGSRCRSTNAAAGRGAIGSAPLTGGSSGSPRRILDDRGGAGTPPRPARSGRRPRGLRRAADEKCTVTTNRLFSFRAATWLGPDCAGLHGEEAVTATTRDRWNAGRITVSAESRANSPQRFAHGS